MSERAQQDIANPAIKALDEQLRTTQAQLAGRYTQHAESKPGTNKEGTPRGNRKQQRIAAQIAAGAAELAQLEANGTQLPASVDVATLADYRSFKAIDN